MGIHVYFAYFRKEAGGGYSVAFPDVPGAVTEGDDFAGAFLNAKDALESLLDSLVADGRPLPASSAPDVLVERAGNAVVVAIEAETQSEAVRVNVSFDKRLLARLDRAAELGGHTRSGLLSLAVREWLIDHRSRHGPVELASAWVPHLQDSRRPIRSVSLLGSNDVASVGFSTTVCHLPLQAVSNGAFVYSSGVVAFSTYESSDFARAGIGDENLYLAVTATDGALRPAS